MVKATCSAQCVLPEGKPSVECEKDKCHFLTDGLGWPMYRIRESCSATQNQTGLPFWIGRPVRIGFSVKKGRPQKDTPTSKSSWFISSSMVWFGTNTPLAGSDWVGSKSKGFGPLMELLNA